MAALLPDGGPERFGAADGHERVGRVGMLRGEHLLLYVQGALEVRLGIAGAPLRQNVSSKNPEACRRIRVLGAEDTLPDGERPMASGSPAGALPSTNCRPTWLLRLSAMSG